MKFYLVGIKGAGMSALANILLDDNYEVEGCDVDSYIFTEDKLKLRNVKINSINQTKILDNYFVIIGHDFMDDGLLNYLKKHKIPYLEYHHFLSFYLNRNNLISVAGSHGKTTLVGMLSCAFNSSCLRGDGHGVKIGNSLFFLESCEYKNHYLKYQPTFAFITNIDYDHVDYFKKEIDYIDSFKKFSSKVSLGLINYEDAKKIANPLFLTYGLNSKADFFVINESVDADGIKGDLYFQNEYITSFEFHNMYGKHMLENLIATLAFAYLNHYEIELVKNRLKEFKMAKKRFNILKYDQQVIIEDYAHHPSQIKVNYQTASMLFPNKKHIAFFKPDRPSRIEYFLNDYKKELSKFDRAYIINFNDKSNIEILKKLENEKITYINDISKYQFDFKKEQYVFSLMSSKNLDEVKKIILSHFNIK